MNNSFDNKKPPNDPLLQLLADYAYSYESESPKVLQTASDCLFDALGCGILALADAECRNHVGPVVPGAELTDGVKIPGTRFQLDPVQGAFNIGTMVRWLDYNDTWLAAEWGHPSDNLGAILACACYANSQRRDVGLSVYTMRDVLLAMVKAYEIQGVLALKNSFNRIGLDHVILVRIASTAVATSLLGGDRQMIVNALSNAWIDGGALRTYRHSPNTGWRKSWAAGDATSRATWHALNALKGEMGYPSALSAKGWGFYDVLFKGKAFELEYELDSYVMENILFKVSYPVEFHAQTAVECAIELHAQVLPRLNEIDYIILTTQEAAMRIINKTGPLHNHADRDHCIQYAVAIALLFGTLEREHYSDAVALDPRIDGLRALMRVEEVDSYSVDYLDPNKRAIGNGVAVHFTNGESIHHAIDYPIGHRRRRDEAHSLLREKFKSNVENHYEASQANTLLALMDNLDWLMEMPVDDFMSLWQAELTEEKPAGELSNEVLSNEVLTNGMLINKESDANE